MADLSTPLRLILSSKLGLALPLLLLGGVIAMGMSPEQVDQFREKHRVAIRLITGFTLLVLASFIYWQLI